MYPKIVSAIDVQPVCGLHWGSVVFDWHSGQWSAAYTLACQWTAWPYTARLADVEDTERELPPVREDRPESVQLGKLVEYLRYATRQKRHMFKIRRPDRRYHPKHL